MMKQLRKRALKLVVLRYVVEHLYRWNNWALEKKSQDFVKKNADTIEFNVSLNPDEEKVVTYTARYSW